MYTPRDRRVVRHYMKIRILLMYTKLLCYDLRCRLSCDDTHQHHTATRTTYCETHLYIHPGPHYTDRLSDVLL